MSIKLSKAVKNIALGGVLVATASAAQAATQGTAGPTSQGTVDISLTIADEVKVSNLVDITLPPFTGVDMQGTSQSCVYRNTGVAYNITATGDGGTTGTNEFRLDNGTTEVDYTVEWDDGNGFSALTTNTAEPCTNAEPIDDDCVTAGTNNANVRVTVAAAAAAGLPASTYTGTLTLLVAPI